MKIIPTLFFLTSSLSAHPLTTDDREALRAHVLAEWQQNRGMVHSATPQYASAEAPKDIAKAPPQAAPFVAFAPKVNAKWDDDFLYLESNAMPAHRMMVGITAWQQQVPIPQKYFGENAWRIPLKPVVAKNPMSAKSHFFKGAIALAANGVPIFNPIKTNGHTDTFLAGELDEFGGHCGRADDYHYHIAPTHLQAQVGKGNPVAYALDGYPIYGFTEPDGSPVTGLDEFNGHESAALGYHYHATKTYPYLNGGFHGEVVEQEGQVHPQPRTSGVREALPPLPGAKITGYSNEGNKFSVKYQVGGEARFVNYTLNGDSTVKFEFVDAQGQVTTETHSPRERGSRPPGGGGSKGKGDRGKAKGKGGQRPEPMREDVRRPEPRREGEKSPKEQAVSPATAPLLITPKHSGRMVLTSPAFADGDALPDEFNGNGEGATPPLAWKGAPEGTQSFALVMDHIDRDSILKTYWTMYDIPGSATSLPKNSQAIGKFGATWKRDQTYVPPHSAGGARQTYTIHLYALPAAPQFESTAGPVTREQLLTAIKDRILDSAELRVTYQRARDDERGGSGGQKGKKPRPQMEGAK
ncbi:MAG: YHYH protein [Verrucomicrobiaceae bacterium]